MNVTNVQYIVDAEGRNTGVILPIDLWEEITSEDETNYLLKNETMKNARLITINIKARFLACICFFLLNSCHAVKNRAINTILIIISLCSYFSQDIVRFFLSSQKNDSYNLKVAFQPKYLLQTLGVYILFFFC